MKSENAPEVQNIGRKIKNESKNAPEVHNIGRKNNLLCKILSQWIPLEIIN